MTRQQARANLLNAVRLVVDATKTYEYYSRVIDSLVRSLYRDEIDASEFSTTFAELINQQLTEAWYGGMRENGLDPIEEMEPKWQTILDDYILKEYDYILGFADDIVVARDEQSPIDPLLSRADIWSNRYNDVKNAAIVATGNQKLIWVYGDTDHCVTCERLNGIVAWAEEWEEAGVVPQNPPNQRLSCGGWRCKCELIPTSNRHTRNALEAIQQALGL
jgi:hypothetical protein